MRVSGFLAGETGAKKKTPFLLQAIGEKLLILIILLCQCLLKTICENTCLLFYYSYCDPGGGKGYSLIWLIRGCAAGQDLVFGLFVLNRVYNFMCLGVLNRVCYCHVS